MKKQTKKQTVAKRQAAKPKTKPNVKPKAKQTAKSTAQPKTKPTAKPTKAKPVGSPATVEKPPIAKSVVRSNPVAVLPPPSPPVRKPAGKPEQSESEELRRIEIALAEVENTLAGETGQAVTINSVSAALITDLTELLEELIDTASPKLSSTVSRLAYVLCEVIPGLQAVSKRADIALCRKCGVTFGWDRQAEAERAVRSGQYQKSITVS
jgi:hypothetical protein